ncbi:MAG: amidohydrolase, partial [Paracoccaceae bacterium]
TTTLLATAVYLSEHPDFFGSVRFIFQPAEELLTGAATMIAEGLFDRFPCDEIYALHNMPGLAVGTIGVPVGAAMASADAIDLIIHADGTHASAPHTGADGVLAACAFITSLQQVSTRVIDARRAGVVSFGVIQGGSVRNILPATVTLQGTLRTNDATARERLIKSIHDVARATGRMRLSDLRRVIIETAYTSVALYTVLFGALMLSKLLTMSGLAMGVLAMVQSTGLEGIALICCILLVFLVLGCVMDSMAIILIFVPLFAPIVVAQGYDLVWFGVIVVVATEIAMITPPIGMNVFVLKAVLPDVKIQAIFKGLIPFIAADTIRLAVLVLVPGLSLWLGSTL